MNIVINKVKELVVKEIKLISGFFPYNIRKYFNPALIYSRNVLVFLNNNPAASKLPPGFLNKLSYLLAGIELTAIGINLHSFNAKDFMLLTGNQKFRQKNEKSYTLDLLFGDIFYSRSVTYFMEYGDFLIFNGILDSVKEVHKNKLFFQRQLAEEINKNIIEMSNLSSVKTGRQIIKKYENKMERLINENLNLIVGMNSLLKTSFILGWALFADLQTVKFPGNIINRFILIKAYGDLEDFINQLPEDAAGLKKIRNITSQKNFIKAELNGIISDLKPDWLKANFKILGRSY